MFETTDNGFRIKFANGWTVSVQWNPGNYSDNHQSRMSRDTKMASTTAEVAAWDKDGKWFDFGDNTVYGWTSPEDVARFIYLISAFDNPIVVDPELKALLTPGR